MEEKYYIDIDENRKLIGRYLASIHGDNIPNSAKQVSQEVFETSMQENHNYLSGDLTTELRDMRTAEEIVEEERLAKLPTMEEQEKMKIELILMNLLEQGGMI